MASEEAAGKAIHKVFFKYLEPLDVDETYIETMALSFVEECKDRDRPFGSVAECTATVEDLLMDHSIEGDDDDLGEELAEGMSGIEFVYGRPKAEGESKITEVPIEVGDAVLAVLSEDGEWHEAKVEEVLEDGRFRVVFAEFGKPQEVARDSIVAESAVDGDSDDEEGTCPMCKRVMPLTRHHVVPRTTWPRMRKKGWLDADLVNTVDICRPCHSAVHRAEDEYSLAKDWNTLEKLMEHPELIRWMKWAATQKVIRKADAHGKLRHKK